MYQCFDCGREIAEDEEVYQAVEDDGTPRNPSSPDYASFCEPCFIAGGGTTTA